MALGDGDTWGETDPTDSTFGYQVDDYIRHLTKGVRSRMALEHEWPSSQSATSEAGRHRFITLQATTSVTAFITGTQLGALYLSTDQALIFENTTGSVTLIRDGTGTPAINACTVTPPSTGHVYATSSAAVILTTYATLTAMSLTLTPAHASNPVFIEFSGRCSIDSVGDKIFYRINDSILGQLYEGETECGQGTQSVSISMHRFLTLAVTTHTLTVQVKMDAGTSTFLDRAFSVIEYKQN